MMASGFVSSQMVKTPQPMPKLGVHSVATLRGIAVTTGTEDVSDQLWNLARTYLQKQEVTGKIGRVGKVDLDDVFRLLERLAKQLDRSELRRIYDLLTELSVVRENTLLTRKAMHEARLIRAMKSTGRMGKFLSIVLGEAT
jgi:hypothetical protein